MVWMACVALERADMPEGVLLTGHTLVLSFLARYRRITARELSAAVGITVRATRKIIADLDAAGYIAKKREGWCTRYLVNADLPLRHHAHRDTAIGDLLEVLGWEGRRRPRRKLGEKA